MKRFLIFLINQKKVRFGMNWEKNAYLAVIVQMYVLHVIVLMSKDSGGSEYTSSVNYSYSHVGKTDHYIANLSPNNAYSILSTGDSTKTIALDSGAGYTSDASGVLSFSVANDNSISKINSTTESSSIGTGTSSTMSAGTSSVLGN